MNYSENSIDYSKYTFNVSPENPDSVINAISSILTCNELKESNQKLHAIGLILDGNKESYIIKLRREIEKLNKVIEQSGNGELVNKYKSICEQKNILDNKLNKYKNLEAELYRITQSNNDLQKVNKKLRESLKQNNVSQEKKKVVVIKKKS